MKPIIHSILSITIIVTAISCSEPSLYGHWKLKELDLMDLHRKKKRFTLDLDNPEKMKAELYNQINSTLNEWQPDTIYASKEEDTADTKMMVKALKDIDTYVASVNGTGIAINKDNSFQMKSSGLIVPTAIPGWKFGDSLEGQWTKTSDTLILSIGEGSYSYQWKFKILQQTSTELNLHEVFDGFEGRGNELRFVRK